MSYKRAPQPKAVPPDVLEARRAKETLERELIFGIAKYYKFYQAVREKVCPYDPDTLSHRNDFSVDRYNVLFRALAAFYQRFASRSDLPEGLGIPTVQLAAYIIDWTNRSGIPADVGQQLHDEITQEKEFTDALTFTNLLALYESPAFADWLETRVTLQTMNQLDSRRQMGTLTMENLEEAVAAARQSVSMVGGSGNDMARPIGEFHAPDEDDDGELIGPGRFICRDALATLVGPSGIGKSTLAMQFAISFAMGKEIFGFKPNKGLKIVIIQGENDDGDIAEMRDGAIAGLGLTEADKVTVSTNVFCCRCNSSTGKKFIQVTVRNNLQRLKPDLLIIDPALCYVGGDTREQKVVGEFLRTYLLPELQRANCGCLLLHHTNKPPTQNSNNGKFNDDAYAEGGSSEFRNVARAVISLRSMGSGSVFELRVPKRGNRLGWVDDANQPTTKKFIKHSTKRDQLFWEVASEDEVKNANTSAQDNKSEMIAGKVLTLIPKQGDISQADLLAEAKMYGVGDKSCRDAVKALLAGTKPMIRCTEKPRGGKRPEMFYSLITNKSIPGGGST